MTYRFSGAISSSRVLNLGSLGGLSRPVSEPFLGTVHAFAADFAVHELQPWEEEHLLDWSRNHPNEPLIYLIVECFGGACEHGGWVAKGGAIQSRFDLSETHQLTDILAAGDISVPSSTVPFLERNYFSFDDDAFLRRAFALARSQAGRTGKNPAVGCVIAGKGQQLSEGATSDGGSPHAEEIALTHLGGSAKGATAYVTLEPCRQRSVGGLSCSEKFIDAGITRVVCPIADQHPNGAGGFDRLREHGIMVETGMRADEARGLYADFFQTL